MKPSLIDWRVMRGSLALLALSLAAGGAAVAGGYYYQHAIDQRYRTEQRRLESVRTRYRTIDEERRLIERYLPAYHALVARGVVGRERRLAWIETLREVAEQIKLPSLRYEISAQMPYQPEIDLALGPFQVYESRMRLDLGLLHEGDLLRFLDALQAREVGLFLLRSCEIKRRATELVFAPRAVNLRALCELSWLTVHRPEGES